MNKWDNLYIDFCCSVSKLSTAKRLKVGAVIVKDDNIISYGYNGTPKGFDNECEISNSNGTLTTKCEVIHAEINAISKAARIGISTLGATLYCNISPCIECAKIIIQSGISTVIYKDEYRNTEGIRLLEKAKVKVLLWQ